MKFSRSAPSVLIVAATIVVVALSAISYALFSGLTQSMETAQFELMESIVEDALTGAQNKALARAELVAELPTTARLLAAGDRPGLLAEYAAMFEGQNTRHGVDQAQFHVPPATSFLRLHDPATFGDDLTAFRPMVVAVNGDRTARKGYAIARSGPAVFGVAPVFDAEGTHVGSFEIGIDFVPLLIALKQAHGLDLALYVDAAMLEQFAQGVDRAVFSDESRVGSLVRFAATDNGLLAELVGPSDLVAVKEPARFDREASGNPYGVLLIPIADNAGQHIGIIAAARDFSATRSSAAQNLVWQIVFGVIAVVILAGFILIVVRGLLLRPLAELDRRIAALREGDAPPPLVDAERYPAELQAVLALYERVRADRDRNGAPQ